MKKFVHSARWCCALLSSAALVAQAAEPADLVLRQGKIYRVSASGPAWATAVAIRNGKFIAVGQDGDIAPYIGPATQVVDLQGRMAMPGLLDAHIHPVDAAYEEMFHCRLPPSAKLPELLDAVKACAGRAAPGDWIVAAAYASAIAPDLEKRESLRRLDEASAGHPVVIRDDSYHNRWVNSEVLRLAGIQAGSTPPPGSAYVFDNGEPTGLLKEFPAFDKVQQLIPPRKPERLLQAAQSAMKTLNALGVTSIQPAMVNRTELDVWHKSDQLPGGLSVRVVATLAGAKGSTDDEPGGLVLHEASQKMRSELLRPDFVKFFLDGVPMAYTSAMLEPYAPHKEHGHDFRGQAHYTTAQLTDQIAVLDQRGIPVKLHAAGDAAVRLALDAIEEVRKRNGSNGPRHQIAHANWVAPADMTRFKKLNVTAEMSPAVWFPTPVTPVLERVLGRDRTAATNPMKSLVNAGAPMAIGSDWPAAGPVPDPWIGIESAVTRQDPSGHVPGVLGPSERIPLETVLRFYTRDNAQAMGLGTVTGSIDVGKSADLIELNQNPFQVPIAQVHQTKVLRTYLQGRLVYDGSKEKRQP